MTMDVVLRGDHEAYFDPPAGHEWQEYIQASLRLLDFLERHADTCETCARRVEFVTNLPTTQREGATLFVHGCPRNPTHEYIFTEDM